MSDLLTSDRLKLRPLALSDAPFIVELFNSPSWLEYIGDRGVRTIEDAEHFLSNNALRFFREHGWGTYLMLRKEDDTPIGTVGLYQRKELETPDFGYALLKAFEGQGLAYEGTSALLKHYTNKLDLDQILAIVQANNTRSLRLLDKLGFLRVRSQVIGTEELEVYRLAKP